MPWSGRPACSFELVLTEGASDRTSADEEFTLVTRTAPVEATPAPEAADDRPSPGMARLLARIAECVGRPVPAPGPGGEIQRYVDILGLAMAEEAVAEGIAAAGAPTAWTSAHHEPGELPGYETLRVNTAGMRFDFEDGRLVELSVFLRPSSTGEYAAHPRSATMLPAGIATRADVQRHYPDIRPRSQSDGVRLRGSEMSVAYHTERALSRAGDDAPIAILTLRHRL